MSFMFVNSINPELLRIGPFSVRFYGIVYALGFLLVYYLMQKAAEKRRIPNLDKDKAGDIVILGMVFGIIGARIFHVISDFYLYKDNLLGIFAIWNGGLGFFGGIAGLIISILIYCKKHNIELIKILDVISLPVPLVVTFGRLANFMNSEHLGSPSDVPWCVVYDNPIIKDLTCRHPVQVYEAISMLILFFFVFLTYRLWEDRKGVRTWSFVLGYGIARFTTDFFRQTQSGYLFGLAHTQILSVIMVLIGAYYLHKSISRGKVRK